MSNSKLDFDGAVAKEAAEYAALFDEDIEFTLWNLRPTYTEFRVSRINGITPAHKIVVSYYDRQAYIPLSNRIPWKSLIICDLDVHVRYGQVGNIANISYFVMREGASREELEKRVSDPRQLISPGDTISLVESLELAYSIGGYGEHWDRENYDLDTVRNAKSISTEATGVSSDIHAKSMAAAHAATLSTRLDRAVESHKKHHQ